LALFEVRSLVGRRGYEVRLSLSAGDKGIRLSGRVPCRADVAGVVKRERLGLGFTGFTNFPLSLIMSYRPKAKLREGWWDDRGFKCHLAGISET
jgi:hypothetical protein